MIAPFPDTKLVKEATGISVLAHTPAFLHHSLRVFLLGREVGRRRGLPFDEEGLLLAALFHDLGLSAPHRNPKRAFPEVGAGLLQELVSSHGESERAVALAEAIDLHLQLVPRWSRSVEAGLLHLGNVIDVTGLRAKEVGAEFLQEVRQTFPRMNLIHEGSRALGASLGSFRSFARLLVPQRRPHPAVLPSGVTQPPDALTPSLERSSSVH